MKVGAGEVAFVTEGIDDETRRWLRFVRPGARSRFEGGGGFICTSYRGEEMIGRLAIDAEGLSLVVAVSPKFRRQGVATEMFRQLEARGLARDSTGSA